MSARATSSGRAQGARPGIERARDLISLVGALSHQGDAVDVATVAARLGIGAEEAHDLVGLLLSVGGDGPDALRLPLVPDEDGSLRLETPVARAVGGRPLRLTPDEAQALAAAFDTLALPPNDDLRLAVERALFPPAPDLTAVSPTDEDASLATRLAELSQAVLAQVALEFDYRPAGGGNNDTDARGGRGARRHVLPQALRREQGRWYLDAFDLDRGAGRSFRVDRMGDPVTTEANPPDDVPTGEATTRTVSLTFRDRALLELHEWPGLVICGQGHGSVNCEVPWYPGSDWLPRHLAACGSAVRIYDPELRAATDRYARAVLARRPATPVPSRPE